MIHIHILHTYNQVFQDLDIQQNPAFKKAERKAKALLMTQRLLDPKLGPNKAKLSREDITFITKRPIEQAMSKENNLRGWARIGISPFTRRVYWELLAKEKKAEAKRSGKKKGRAKGEEDDHLAKMTLETAIGEEPDQEPCELTEQQQKDGKITREEQCFLGPANREELLARMTAKAKAKADARAAAEKKKAEAQAKREKTKAAQRAFGRKIHDGWSIDHASPAYKGIHLSPKMTDDQIKAVLVYLGEVPNKGKKEARYRQLTGCVLGAV